MKILVTVGAQMPFDRLIAVVDTWVEGKAGVSVLAQVGESLYQSRNVESVEFFQPNEFRQKVMWADVLVAHAGMGSILTALQFGKPIIVMPRLGRLKETRNDHQVATARRFAAMSGVVVAMDETELVERLDNANAVAASDTISPYASPQLLDAVRQFIAESA